MFETIHCWLTGELTTREKLWNLKVKEDMDRIEREYFGCTAKELTHPLVGSERSKR